MVENRYSGDVEFPHDGKTIILRGDWLAIADAQEWSGEVNCLQKLSSLSIKQLSQVVAAFMQKHQPGTKADDVMTANMPIALLIAKVERAALFSYVGAGGVKASDDLDAKAVAAKKKK
jgi:hypothetical protein